MLKQRNALLVVLLVATLFAVVEMVGISFAQKTAFRRPQVKLALEEDGVKRLLLLVDTNKTGKMTKQEWMKIMEAEFDRLDKDKSGALDAKELAQSQLHISPQDRASNLFGKQRSVDASEFGLPCQQHSNEDGGCDRDEDVASANENTQEHHDH